MKKALILLSSIILYASAAYAECGSCGGSAPDEYGQTDFTQPTGPGYFKDQVLTDDDLEEIQKMVDEDFKLLLRKAGVQAEISFHSAGA